MINCAFLLALTLLVGYYLLLISEALNVGCQKQEGEMRETLTEKLECWLLIATGLFVAYAVVESAIALW